MHRWEDYIKSQGNSQLQLFPRNVNVVLSYCTEVIIVTVPSQACEVYKQILKSNFKYKIVFTLFQNNFSPLMSVG